MFSRIHLSGYCPIKEIRMSNDPDPDGDFQEMRPGVSFVTTRRGELLRSPIVSSHSSLTA